MQYEELYRESNELAAERLELVLERIAEIAKEKENRDSYKQDHDDYNQVKGVNNLQGWYDQETQKIFNSLIIASFFFTFLNTGDVLMFLLTSFKFLSQ